MLDLPARSESGADASALAEALARHARASGLALPLRGFGLAARVLAVTIGFVLLAMSLFYVTRLTAHREMWLHNKISCRPDDCRGFRAGRPDAAAPGLVAKDPQQRRREVDRDRDAGGTARVRCRRRRADGRRGHHRGREFLFRQRGGHVSRAVRRARDDREARRCGSSERAGDRVRLRRDAADPFVVACLAQFPHHFSDHLPPSSPACCGPRCGGWCFSRCAA